MTRTGIRDVLKGRAPWPLLLWGDSGSGKSCAALCVLDCYGGLYLDAQQFAEVRNQIQQGQFCTSAGYPWTNKEVWNVVDKANVVVLDELGTRTKVSDHQYGTVKRVLDRREETPLILVSNLSPKELAEAYDDRIASRATAGTVIEMSGDRRRQ